MRVETDVERKRKLLAAKVGEEPAANFIEAVTKKARRLGTVLDEEVDALLQHFDIDPTATPPVPQSLSAFSAAEPATPADASQPGRLAPEAPTTKMAAAHLDGGFAPVPNRVLDELLSVMPAAVMKAYLVCCRLAKRDGSFRASCATLARRAGYSSRAKNGQKQEENLRKHGVRMMRPLRAAGLIKQVEQGGPGKANAYRLAEIASIDFGHALTLLRGPVTKRKSKPIADAASAMSSRIADERHPR